MVNNDYIIPPRGVSSTQGEYAQTQLTQGGTPLNNNKGKNPLHLRLTHSEWVGTVKGLTGAEIKVLFYCKTLDPFADRNIEYSVTTIANDLSLGKGTVSKALKRLDSLSLLDAEITRAKIRVTIPAFPIGNEFPIGNNVSYEKPKFPIGNPGFPEETSVSYRKQPEAETQSQSESQTSSNYSDFIKTLSHSERERFLTFVKEKTQHFSPAIANLHDYLSAKERWKEFWNDFRGVVSSESNAGQDWEKHPRWNEALAAMRHGVPRFMGTGYPGFEDMDRKTRIAMARYASKNNLIWGEES